MKFLFIAAIPLLLCLSTSGQNKHLSYEQAFTNAPVNIFKPLPRLLNWIDDDRLIIEWPGINGDPNKRSLVDITSKTIKPYAVSAQAISLPLKSKSLPKGTTNYTLSPDQHFAAYTYKNNLYIINTSTEEIIPLTSDGNDSVMNGYASWLYHEEIIGRSNNYRAFWWSDDSRQLVFMRFDDSPVPVFPIYVATGQYGYLEKQRYPKAGDKNPKVRIGLINITSRKLIWADFDENDDQYFRPPYFTTDNQLWMQWVNRQQNNLKIFRIDAATGSKQEIYNEKQDTWVTQNDGVYFLPGQELFINKSDKSGWAHFYLHDMSGKLINQVTSGKYSVGYIVKSGRTTNTIYFTARKENSARNDLYSVNLDGSNFKRITTGQYSYSDISIAPGNNFFIATYSNTGEPTAIAVFDMQGKRVMDIGSIKGADFNNYVLPKKELRRTATTDGLFQLPFTITYPVNFNELKKYPVIMNVYGGPYRTDVYDTWALSSTDIWWAQEGIIQVIADNRGSGHFGKEGMNYIYGKAGQYEIEDFMAVGRWLKQQPWVDTGKLCITGFSHGGFMACMGLTYGADVFNYGIAYWPLTDWHLYDTYYTERYMGKPGENAEGYKITSVLTHAANYKGLLRIVHGTSDDNTHVQNTLQLIDTLQNLHKQFELMVYPGARHGLSGAKWKHNKTETYRFYYQYLLNRKIPGIFLK